MACYPSPFHWGRNSNFIDEHIYEYVNNEGNKLKLAPNAHTNLLMFLFRRMLLGEFSHLPEGIARN